MLSLIFTLDYEIHGNGEGCPFELMVEPTDRMLRQFDRHGAKLTIMADVAEIMRFKELRETSGQDAFHYEAIADQLRRAVQSGHDVQLHIHSSYFKARYENGRWVQDWSEYNFAGLSVERMDWMVRECKAFLESLLRPVQPSYRCTVFRAANWSVSPSQNVVPILVKNGIEIDTSVFKYGRRDGLVNFDYTGAHHAILPWRADEQDICRPNPSSPLWEFPIYCERRWVGAFASPNRLYRAFLGRLHKIEDALFVNGQTSPRRDRLGWIFKKQAYKADFNQCSGRQLIRSLLAAEKQAVGVKLAPFVMIGHSKLFTRWNERSLEPLFRFVRKHPSRFSFGLFGSFQVANRAVEDANGQCVRGV